MMFFKQSTNPQDKRMGNVSNRAPVRFNLLLCRQIYFNLINDSR